MSLQPVDTLLELVSMLPLTLSVQTQFAELLMKTKSQVFMCVSIDDRHPQIGLTWSVLMYDNADVLGSGLRKFTRELILLLGMLNCIF